ncbi:hypothetical protein [Rhodococcus sp. ARC_M6]|uniref:hypothetical protein n=1 Tax=Rhodococcus sp. ARC_M6 TaxID=2928852 RepID=UPI001FB3F8EC|nr:hypothetical protein [Rhodococcus sp. ARC_M6]MCJ0903667.1 hypothetical protein [Rhodococcus sp. ARC_M6]
MLAERERRSSRGLTVTDPLLVESAARLREQFQNPAPTAGDADQLVGDLGDYDRASELNSAALHHVMMIGCRMGAVDPVKDIEHYAQVMKAPRIRESAVRLAEQSRSDGWRHEDYLAAVLSREVAVRESSVTQIRIRSARFPNMRRQRGPSALDVLTPSVRCGL